MKETLLGMPPGHIIPMSMHAPYYKTGLKEWNLNEYPTITKSQHALWLRSARTTNNIIIT